MVTAASVLFVAGLVTVSAAAVAYVLQFVAVRVPTLAGLTPAGAVTLTGQRSLAPLAGRAGTGLAWLTVGLLGAAMAARTIAVQRPPFGTLWEYFIVFGMGIVLCYLLFERRYGERSIGAATLPLVAILLAISHTSFTSGAGPLSPPLQNNPLLAIHVGTMIVSYSVLAVAFGAAVIVLMQGNRDRFARLPSAARAEAIQHKAVLIGFPLLGLGIALGAYWGHHAWGRYWGWDPKETAALASWLVFAGYMHARALGSWRGARSASLVVLGFGVILFNIFVVNFVISGLHSYAGG